MHCFFNRIHRQGNYSNPDKLGLLLGTLTENWDRALVRVWFANSVTSGQLRVTNYCTESFMSSKSKITADNQRIYPTIWLWCVSVRYRCFQDKHGLHGQTFQTVWHLVGVLYIWQSSHLQPASSAETRIESTKHYPNHWPQKNKNIHTYPIHFFSYLSFIKIFLCKRVSKQKKKKHGRSSS